MEQRDTVLRFYNSILSHFTLMQKGLTMIFLKLRFNCSYWYRLGAAASSPPKRAGYPWIIMRVRAWPGLFGLSQSTVGAFLDTAMMRVSCQNTLCRLFCNRNRIWRRKRGYLYRFCKFWGWWLCVTAPDQILCVSLSQLIRIIKRWGSSRISGAYTCGYVPTVVGSLLLLHGKKMEGCLRALIGSGEVVSSTNTCPPV